MPRLMINPAYEGNKAGLNLGFQTPMVVASPMAGNLSRYGPSYYSNDLLVWQSKYVANRILALAIAEVLRAVVKAIYEF